MAHRPADHPATLSDEALLAQCDLTKGRTSGPGGQHRNKVETKVILHHHPTGIEAHASERRSVIDNRRVALKRLRLTLAVEIRCPVAAGEIGSPLWKSRVKAPRPRHASSPRAQADDLGALIDRLPDHAPARGSIVCSPSHHDYPSLLAEALDVIADAGWDLKPAAARLNVSPTQLLRFIKDHPPALLKINSERKARGEHAYK